MARGAGRSESETAQGASQVIRGGTAQGAGLREGGSTRRRAARGRQRKAPGYERRAAQGAGLREGDSARRRAARAEQRTEAPNCENGMHLHINIVLTTYKIICGLSHIHNMSF
eukprot:5805934-Pleurochrysis_carterae.AAC.1